MSKINQEKPNHLFFFRDEFDGDFEKFNSLEEALAYAKIAINDLGGEDGWPQEVLDGAFQIGIITHESGEANRRENDVDDEGEVINNSFDFICDIEMAEVESNPVEKIKELEKLIEQARPWVNAFLEHDENRDFNDKVERWLKTTLNL